MWMRNLLAVWGRGLENIKTLKGLEEDIWERSERHEILGPTSFWK